jgi:uncharacterized protein (TIGR03118 family)
MLKMPWHQRLQRLFAPAQDKRSRSRVRLQLECLEDRSVPTITLASANFSATAGTAFNGTVATFTDSNVGAVASDFRGTINWGDSATSPGDGNAVQILADPVTSGQFDVKGTHTYAAAGSFTVTATVSDNQGNSSTAAAFYRQTDLVTDNQANLATDGYPSAAHVDPNLVNPWGISFAPSGPFWVANNNTGTTTLYDGTGATAGAAITIAASANPGATSPGPATGTVYNGTSDFNVAGPGTPAQFIFATEDGTIAAWYIGSTAPIKVDNADFTNGPVYKGLAIGSNATGNFLYASNFRAGTIDVFDKNFQKITLGTGGFGTFTDPDPNHDLTGYAPFGIQNIGGKIYVTYAQQNAAKHDDVGGAGNGFVDVFDTSGNFSQRLVSHGPLDSPWGLAIAPASFGAFAGDLLVGNFKDGHINAFNPITGALAGQLTGANGQPIVIDHLWGLTFGNGAGAGSANTLYFAAGINAETHGLFGSLAFVPASGGTATVSPAGFVYDAATQTLTVTGTSFNFSQATTADASGTHTTYNFVIDGKTDSLPDTQLAHVIVNGQGAGASATLITNDTYTVPGRQTQETAELVVLGAGRGQIEKVGLYGNTSVFLQLNAFPTSYAYVGRADSGQLMATIGGENIFVSAGSYSYITGMSQFHLISGSSSIYGYSVNSTDQAWHYDTAALDAFVSSGRAFSYMSGTDAGQSFFNVAVGFGVNYGIATHGRSIAYLIDSPGNDTFFGSTALSYLSGTTAGQSLFNEAEGFALVNGESFVGGMDFAYNFDPNHNLLAGKWILLT